MAMGGPNARCCVHNRQTRYCKVCGGAALCVHDRVKRYCKVCKGAGRGGKSAQVKRGSPDCGESALPERPSKATKTGAAPTPAKEESQDALIKKHKPKSGVRPASASERAGAHQSKSAVLENVHSIGDPTQAVIPVKEERSQGVPIEKHQPVKAEPVTDAEATNHPIPVKGPARTDKQKRSVGNGRSRAAKKEAERNNQSNAPWQDAYSVAQHSKASRIAIEASRDRRLPHPYRANTSVASVLGLCLGMAVFMRARASKRKSSRSKTAMTTSI